MEITQDLKSRLDFLLFLPPLIIHRTNIFMASSFTNSMKEHDATTYIGNVESVCDTNVSRSFVSIQDQLNKNHEKFHQNNECKRSHLCSKPSKTEKKYFVGIFYSSKSLNTILCCEPDSTLNKIFTIFSYLRLCIVCIYLRNTKEETERLCQLETLIPLGILALCFFLKSTHF